MALTEEDKRWFSEQLGGVENRFSGELERIETRFSSELERVETRLLTEFHKWASPVELRQKSDAAALRAMDIEIESSADRVKNLETSP